MKALRDKLKKRVAGKLVGIIASNEDARRFYRGLPGAKISDEGIWIELR